MTSNREPSGGLLGVLAAGIGLCCGLPLFLGTGIAIGATGAVIGSGLLIAAGVAVGAWAWHHRRRRIACDPETRETRRPSPTRLTGHGTTTNRDWPPHVS